MNIWNWITSNWQEIVAAVGGIVLAARIIVKLTPNPGLLVVLIYREHLPHMG
jgi:hypothetical protein